ncbi:MAG: hypothetical protein KatS3mg124_0481 [Porticoccaceae bacterium]|nr:MAG: hypothetical protein KatS3mg124_0481 [Porticoccaceae bacterium]
MLRLLPAALAFLFLWPPGVALAWRECLERPAEARFACLAEREVDHAGELEFDRALAEAARLAGRADYAAVVLERLVLLHPEAAGDRLDLVVLALALGDLDTASRHLEFLLALPDPPPAAARLLRELERRLAAPAAVAGARRHRLEFQWSLGYDDNANLGMGADALELLVGGVPVRLEPDETFAPDARPFTAAGARFDWAYAPAGRLRGRLDGRLYRGVTDEDSLSGAIEVEHGLTSALFLRAGASDYRLRDGLWLSRAGAALGTLFGACRCLSLAAGLDGLEGSEDHFRALRGHLDFDGRAVFGPLLLHGWGVAGYQRQPDAPWGDTRTLQLGLDLVAALAGGRLRLGASRYWGADEADYSPLFGNRRRDPHRDQWHAGFDRPIGWGLSAFLEATWIEQGSAVPLYDYDRFLIEAGLRLAL